MRTLAVLFLLLGVVAMFHRSTDTASDAGHKAVAVNYAVYRNAVFLYVAAHRGYSGTIQQASLSLPNDWRAMRAWSARVDGGRCYVYGEASQEEIAAVRDLFHGSFALGMASGGRLVPVLGNAIAVPAFIPNGYLVSVTEVD
jgi:hypothetical protein